MKFFKKLGQVIFPRQKGRKKKDLFVMGARYDKQQVKQTKESEGNTEERVRDVETYFRPSCEAVLNNQLTDFHFFLPYYDKSYKEITLPSALMASQKEITNEKRRICQDY